MSGGESERSLTGVWQGLYSYPGEIASSSFTATLIESGAALGGSTHEVGLDRHRRSVPLFAVIDGARDGAEVAFGKTYDGSGGWTHTVFYQGRVNADATEIEGRWNIPGVWSGKFLMIREAGMAERAKTRVEEKA